MIDWGRLVSRVTFRFPLELRMVYLDGWLHWFMRVKDHTTGKWKWQDAPPLRVPWTDDEHFALRWLRYWAQVMVLHELDETTYLDERRPFNPHVVFPLPRWDT